MAKRKRYAAALDPAYVGGSLLSAGSADWELMNAGERLRQKTRAMARNSNIGRRHLNLLKTNVIGVSGFRLQVRVKMSTQEMKLDRSLNTRVERAWAEFMRRPTTDRVMDGIELQKQMIETWGRDGEYILEAVYGSQYPDGVVFNPIEADMLDYSLTTVNPVTGNEVRMGVEIDQYRRPVAYHFLQVHPGDMGVASGLYARQRHRRIPADRIIHIYMRQRPGQTRGEMPSAAAPNTITMMDGLRVAEITARRIKASAMGFFIPSEDGPTGRAAELDGLKDREVEEAGSQTVMEMDMEPGTIKGLPPGSDFKQFDPGGAQSDFAEVDQQLKVDAAMGMNISPSSLAYETNKLSYSTHRGVVAEDRDYYRDLQSFFIRMGMIPMFLLWLRSHTSFNELSEIPPTRLMAILGSFKFLPRGWDYIDPSKDATADVVMLRARTTSLSRIAAKKGLDVEELLEEISSDEALLKEYGLTQHLDTGIATQTSNEDDEDDEDTAPRRKSD